MMDAQDRIAQERQNIQRWQDQVDQCRRDLQRNEAYLRNSQARLESLLNTQEVLPLDSAA